MQAAKYAYHSQPNNVSPAGESQNLAEIQVFVESQGWIHGFRGCFYRKSGDCTPYSVVVVIMSVGIVFVIIVTEFSTPKGYHTSSYHRFISIFVKPDGMSACPGLWPKGPGVIP